MEQLIDYLGERISDEELRDKGKDPLQYKYIRRRIHEVYQKPIYCEGANTIDAKDLNGEYIEGFMVYDNCIELYGKKYEYLIGHHIVDASKIKIYELKGLDNLEESNIIDVTHTIKIDSCEMDYHTFTFKTNKGESIVKMLDSSGNACYSDKGIYISKVHRGFKDQYFADRPDNKRWVVRTQLCKDNFIHDTSPVGFFNLMIDKIFFYFKKHLTQKTKN